MATFDLSLHTRATLFVDGEPSDHITTHTAEVVCADDDGDETTAEYVRASHPRRPGGQPGQPLFDVCHSHHQEMHVL